MQRRKFLATVGSLTAGTAAAMGTGAFASVEADRTVNVELVGDQYAYLGLTDESPYAEYNDNNELTLSFSDNGEGGAGMNRDSVTTFDGVFMMTNNGPNALDISIDKSGLAYPDRWHFAPTAEYEVKSGTYPEDNFYPSFDDFDVFNQNTSGGGLDSGKSTLVSVAIDARDKAKLPGGEITFEVVAADGPYGSEGGDD